MDEENCPYTLTKTVSGSLTFTAECYNIVSSINSGSRWSGIVEGKNVKGNLFMMTEKGDNFTYIFTGSELKDSSIELGLR